MSLLDLQKKPSRCELRRQRTTRQVNVEQFIENAQLYANGFDNVIHLPPLFNEPPGPRVPFRKATFTLSEQCIKSLSRLAESTGISKSALIRMLITQLDQCSEVEKELVVVKYKGEGNG